MPDRSFFIFALGPVQDFIASARKCRDLWFGSWLLSEVSRQVAQTIAESCGEEALIFPGSGRWQGDEPVANKIVALVPTGQVLGVAGDCKKRCRDFLDQQARQIEQENFLWHGRWLLEKELARLQIMELLETFWVAVPCAAQAGKTYTDARSRAEKLLAARKSTRNWGPSTWAAAVPKSSLDGKREAVVKVGLPSGEYLCGIGLLKRLGHDRRRPSFHSTSHVAAAPHFHVFEAATTRCAFDHYVDGLEDLAEQLGLGGEVTAQLAVKHSLGPRGEASDRILDGAILYEGRVINTLEEMGNKRLSSGASSQVRKLLREFKARAGLPAVINPHYALVLADGDHMGALIDKQTSFDDHRRLSGALEAFALDAAQLTVQHQGSLIYCGGDDVLALMPLHRLLAFVRKLATAFQSRMKGSGGGTLSVGVAIAHHTVHFGTVRKLAHQAERLAKQPRNALAILFDKRSGGQRSVVGPWEDKDGDPLDLRLGRWQEFLARGEMPHGFIRELEDLARLAEGWRDPAERQPFPDGIVMGEAERIMDRKQARGDAEAPGLSLNLRKDIRACLADTTHGRTLAERVRSLSAELTIALEFSRVMSVSVEEMPA